MGILGITRDCFSVYTRYTLLMAKKKSPPAKVAPADDRVVIVHLKGSSAYAEWLENIHKRTHIAKSTLFRLSMAEWAQRNGYSTPPEI